MIILLILGLAGLGALGGIEFDRRRRAGQAARQAVAEADATENARILAAPFDYLAVAGAEHQRRMSALASARDAVVAARQRLSTELSRLPAAEWTGAALAVRLLAFVVVAALFALGLVLNVEIFAALLGEPSMLAIAFGAMASLMEMLLALLIGHLVRHREPGSPAWHLRLWGALAALAIVLVMVWTYAPMRSTAAIGPQLAVAQRAVGQAETPVDGSSPDPTLVASAKADEDAALDRLQRGRNADQTQAVLLPAGQVLGFELARDGALALLAWRRKRALERGDAELLAEETALDGRVREAGAAAVQAALERLRDAGVRDVTRVMAEGNARNAAPDGLPPGGPGPRSAPPSDPPPDDPPRGGFDPDDLHEPPPPGAGTSAPDRSIDPRKDIPCRATSPRPPPSNRPSPPPRLPPWAACGH